MRRPLIAVLTAITKENNSPLNALVQGLNEFGYVDGVNVDIVYRFVPKDIWIVFLCLRPSWLDSGLTPDLHRIAAARAGIAIAWNHDTLLSLPFPVQIAPMKIRTPANCERSPDQVI